MPSLGADTLRRVPKPDENVVPPFVRVAAKVGLCDDGSEAMSSSVVPPTAIAPLSGTRVGVVDCATSSMVVAASWCEARSVGVLPPSGPTAVGVYNRVPSFDEMVTTMWYWRTIVLT